MRFTIPLLALIPAVLSHGLIQVPPSRPAGAALTANCGSGVAKQIIADNTSHVEGLPEAAAKDSAFKPALCNVWLCKGLQFADNPSTNIQTFTANQTVPITVFIRVPHEGSANVSIVDTKTNTVIGAPLKSWAKGYAAGTTAAAVPLSDKEFSVVIPSGLEEKCKSAGDCVLQWWWYGTAAKQTYESCVDFKIARPATYSEDVEVREIAWKA